MDCTVHGILQPRILEWVAFPFSRGSSQPWDQTMVSHTLQADSLPADPQGKPNLSMSVWAQVHSLCKGAFFCMSAGMLHLFAKRCFVVWVWIMTGQPIFKRGKNVALILWPEPWVSTEMPQYLATLLLPPSLPSFLFFLFVKFLPLFFCYVLPFFCPSFLPPLALFLLLSSFICKYA